MKLLRQIHTISTTSNNGCTMKIYRWILFVLLILHIYSTTRPTMALHHHSSPYKKTITSTQNTYNTTTTIPSWEELDQRPLPQWYDDAKFGIFIHWGIFSVPSYGSEWFWMDWKGNDPYNTNQNNTYQQFVQQTERPNFSYQDYATRFHAELYRPNEWANIFAQSGAQYIVLTSKHHDGFCNWNSKNIPSTWNWNVMDIGPKRDILGELSYAIKNVTSIQTNLPLKFGIYHSLFEWYNPLYIYDRNNNFTTQQFVIQKTLPELYDLVNQYSPELLWSDGDWEAYSNYWNSREFLYWYSTNTSVSSTAVWNDRWGIETLCHHGSFRTCQDRYNPTTYQPNKFENALTIDTSSWGYNRNSTNINMYMTTQEIIHTLIQVVALNGNMLLNIGPNADGTIDPTFLDRLHEIGKWLTVNGEAIYSTKPWMKCQNETISSVYYTTKMDRLYVHIVQWPDNNRLVLHCINVTTTIQITFLGLPSNMKNETSTISSSSLLQWTPMNNENHETNVVQSARRQLTSNTGIEVTLPPLTPNIIPCDHAWVLVITGLDI